MAGQQPREIVSGREIQGMHTEKPKRYPEVLFPEIFTHRQPWDVNPEFSEPQMPATIPIYRLSHITHSGEAQSICAAGDYTFIPKPKYGKSYQYGNNGRASTYKCTDNDRYEEILGSELVFPGSLSWWGIDVRAQYEEGCKLLGSISEQKDNGRYVPGYLANPTESQYGDIAFSTSLSQILQDYSEARLGHQPCLKVGGTLRYRNEICYVVIVCTEEDKLEMPNITEGSPQFVSNGLVDENGCVVDYHKTPEFNATSIIKSEKAGPDPTGRNKYLYNYFSWEQLVFAFYFPKGFICTDIEQSQDIPHYKNNCPKC